MIASAAAETWRALHDSLEQTWDQLHDRLVGLTDAEARWEPTSGCWTVRMQVDGTVVADWADPDPVPAPVTTIAWRLWHITVDALDSYSSRVFGTTGSGLEGTTWVAGAAQGVQLLGQAWAGFLGGLTAMAPEGLFGLLGEGWGPFSDSTILALALHAQREVVHHGAEIGLLRDLYATAQAREPRLNYT